MKLLDVKSRIYPPIGIRNKLHERTLVSMAYKRHTIIHFKFRAAKYPPPPLFYFRQAQGIVSFTLGI